MCSYLANELNSIITTVDIICRKTFFLLIYEVSQFSNNVFKKTSSITFPETQLNTNFNVHIDLTKSPVKLLNRQWINFNNYFKPSSTVSCQTKCGDLQQHGAVRCKHSNENRKKQCSNSPSFLIYADQKSNKNKIKDEATELNGRINAFI